MKDYETFDATARMTPESRERFIRAMSEDPHPTPDPLESRVAALEAAVRQLQSMFPGGPDEQG